MTDLNCQHTAKTPDEFGCDTGQLALCLAEHGASSEDAQAAIRKFGQLLSAAPLRVERLFVSVQPLHPDFRARTYLWLAKDDRVRVIEWPHGLKNRQGYRSSPDHHVHTTGTELRVPDLQNTPPSRCNLYDELRLDGFTDYLIIPLRFSGGTINTLSIATRQPGGFSKGCLVAFRRLADLLAALLERFVAVENLDTALRTYLGRHAGSQVMRGEIRLGEGQLVEAVVLFADLHDFSSLSAQLKPAETVSLLNSYFDCLVAPIEENGGHILKFIGDAVLAFFPVNLPGSPEPRPQEAIAAISQRLNMLNSARMEAGEKALQHGLCLHFGEVLYGNIGSSERLDFTIIGDAVNVASRCLEETHAFGVEYLATEGFVTRFSPENSSHIGTRKLKGITSPVSLHELCPNLT
ncbi:adenylate/guanylate cyclase domain-containing protein [Leisingera sp. F5]|uniref:adenylate/guanylate cyclase domain-containing protein n=1 Tax=Leisingera sp. F5 TaxID=1813816 RepID=UPI000B023943|nr:adenylate/guanylate cyclase domain-containing protein [Leisingera sp. F5]